MAVTGGAGFIGTHLVKALLRGGYDVVVVDNFSSPATPRRLLERSGVEVEALDVLDAAALARVLRSTDALVHLAALIDVRESEQKPVTYARVNVLGTVAALEAAREANVGVTVYASSAAVYGDPQRLPLREDHLPRPASFYGSTKLMGEEACRYYALRGPACTALRFFNVYGELGRRNVVYIFLRAVLSGDPITIYGDGGQTRDFVYVGDVAAAVEASLRASRQGFHVYNVASGVETSIRELVDAVAEVTGRMPEVVFAPERPGEIRRSYASVEKARRELGWSARVKLREGLEAVYQWITAGEPHILP